MKHNTYLPRVIDKTLDANLAAFGAVCIEGPKWCGKTWTALKHGKSAIRLDDPEQNFQNRQLAALEPALVLNGAVPRVIDEWQEVPPIWDAVRYAVDERLEKGQFILTGSATPVHKGIMHSGAGRIARLRMRPMSLFESGDSTGMVSLLELCAGRLAPVMTESTKLEDLISLIVRGGWPESLHLKAPQYALLPAQYISAVLNDDIHRVDGVRRDSSKMMQLLRSLARNESTTATKATLARDIRAVDDADIDSSTVSAYLDVFKRLFLTDNVPPFSTQLRSSVRVRQAEKRHLADPSLACSLLGATPKKLLKDLNTLGFLFEALCERDLRIYAESFGGMLCHYRDYRDQEIDAIVELPDGEWAAFEIKLGANQIDAAAANLLKIRQQIEAEPHGHPPKAMAVICGRASAAYKREDGIFVVPITALRP